MSRFKIVAHRGTSGGLLPENTCESSQLALLSGADAIEVDVTRTLDGRLYAFHDGTELSNLGISQNLTTMTSRQVGRLHYLRGQRTGQRMGVQPLVQVLAWLRGKDVEVHIDRAGRWWPELLAELGRLDMDDQLVLKVAGAADALAALAEQSPKQRVLAMVATADELTAARRSNLPVDIIELINADPDHQVISRDTIELLHTHGYRVLANAEVVGEPLFAGYDDEVSVLEDPAAGWGRLADLGVDLIQTDFPWLLASYRAQLNEAS